MRDISTSPSTLAISERNIGKVTDMSGGPFQLNSRETLASNGLVHEALMYEFAEIFAGRGLEELPDPRAFR